jgi:hypothetical protein
VIGGLLTIARQLLCRNWNYWNIFATTPFLLLAAACYAKSSEGFYNWLINNSGWEITLRIIEKEKFH